MSNKSNVQEVAAKVRQDFAGHVTMLFNNAAIGPIKDILSLSEEEINRTIDVNTKAHFWVQYNC